MATPLFAFACRLIGLLLLIFLAVRWAIRGEVDPTQISVATVLTGVGSSLSTIDEINTAVKQLVFGVCAGAGTSRYKENP